MKKVIINVTAKDIEEAKKLVYDEVKSKSLYCPIALATKRKFKCFIYVGINDVTIIRQTLETYVLPAKACDFILKFDFRKPVEPFKFTLNVE